jgi:putative addiction module component (TIGR02574 family)
MAPTMKELGIDKLSLDDRLALVEEIWNSIAADPDALPLTDDQKRLLSRRMADLDANPGNVLTWDEIKRNVRGER